MNICESAKVLSNPSAIEKVKKDMQKLLSGLITMDEDSKVLGSI